MSHFNQFLFKQKKGFLIPYFFKKKKRRRLFLAQDFCIIMLFNKHKILANCILLLRRSCQLEQTYLKNLSKMTFAGENKL